MSISDSLLEALGFAGDVLDTPGAMVRTAATGRNPLDAVFDTSKRVSGRGLLEHYGLLGANKPGLDFGDVAGFGVEMADPLSWAGGFAAKKGLQAMRNASRLKNWQSVAGADLKALEAAKAASIPEIAKGVQNIEPAWNPAIPKAHHGIARDWENIFDYPVGFDAGIGEIPKRISDGLRGVRPLPLVPRNVGHRGIVGHAPDADEAWSLLKEMGVTDGSSYVTDKLGMPLIGGIPHRLPEINRGNPFYSRLQRAVQGLEGQSVKGSSLPNQLRRASGGLSDTELAASNIPREISAAGAGKVPSHVISEMANDPAKLGIPTVRITERNPARYPTYVTQPAKDYREVLFHNPTHELPLAEHNSFSPETFAHLRTTTRSGPSGLPVHFLDEVQSDLFQAGNTHIPKSYSPVGSVPETADKLRSMNYHGQIGELAISDERLVDRAARDMAYHALHGGRGQAVHPWVQQLFRPVETATHPFSEEWQNIALKKALSDASQAGSPGIGWNTGDTVKGLVGGKSKGQKKFYDTEIGQRLQKLLATKGQKGVTPELSHYGLPPDPERIKNLRKQIKGDIEDVRFYQKLASKPNASEADAWKFHKAHDTVSKKLKLYREAQQSDAFAGHYLPISDEARKRILKEGWPLLAGPLGLMGMYEMMNRQQPGAQ